MVSRPARAWARIQESSPCRPLLQYVHHMWGPVGSIWHCTAPKPSAQCCMKISHHTLHTVSESRALQGRCNIKTCAVRKCNLPSGNLLPGCLCAIPTWRCLLLVEPWASSSCPQVQRAGSGCQGTPQEGRGKAEASASAAPGSTSTPAHGDTPLTLVVLFFPFGFYLRTL